MLPDPRETPFLTVEEAGQLIGLGRSQAYVNAHAYLNSDGAEGLPCIRFGRAMRVPTAALWKLAQLEIVLDDPDATAANIANAVPPHMGPGVAKAMLKVLRQEDDDG